MPKRQKAPKIIISEIFFIKFRCTCKKSQYTCPVLQTFPNPWFSSYGISQSTTVISTTPIFCLMMSNYKNSHCSLQQNINAIWLNLSCTSPMQCTHLKQAKLNNILQYWTIFWTASAMHPSQERNIAQSSTIFCNIEQYSELCNSFLHRSCPGERGLAPQPWS